MTDTEKVQKIMELFENSSLSSMDAELEGLKIHLEKTGHQYTNQSIVQEPAPVMTEAAQPVYSPASVKSEPAAPAVLENLKIVRSPLVGIFYASRENGGKPLVQTGDQVKAGQALCLIEAMKTMNELNSPCDGIIRRILLENGEMAEYDQPIFEIEELKQ